MECTLPSQLKNSDDIKKVLKEVEEKFSLPDGSQVDTLLVYLPIKDGVSSHSEFLELVKQGILYNYVFSYSEITKKLGIPNNDSEVEKLLDKAIRKLSQHTAQGELGELLLFTLLDIYFQAPKILSKVSMKTNPRMPVFGADAVHGQFKDGSFKLYLGESKLYTKFEDASTRATESIKNALNKYEDEFDLLDSHMNFEDLNEELQEILLDLLNPFSEKPNLNELICSPCFIGFSSPDMISKSDSEEAFVERYKEVAKDNVIDFVIKAKKHGINISETALLMLPYSDVNSFVKDFIDYIGIKK